jgi:hypothetical protein
MNFVIRRVVSTENLDELTAPFRAQPGSAFAQLPRMRSGCVTKEAHCSLSLIPDRRSQFEHNHEEGGKRIRNIRPSRD